MDVIVLAIVFELLILAIKTFAKDTIIKFSGYSFVLYWYGSLIVSTLSPYGLFNVSFGSYLLLIIGTISFVAGLLMSFPKKNYFRGFEKSSICLVIEKLVTSKFVCTIYTVFTVYFAKYTLAAMAFAALSGNIQTREQLEFIFLGNAKAQLLHGYVVTPMLHIALVLLAYAFLNLKGNFRRFVIPIVILVFFFIEYLLITGGRSTIIIAAMYFLLTFFVLKYQDGMKILSLKRIIIVLSIFFAVSAVYTFSNIYRTTGTLDITMKEESQDKSAGGLFETMARYSLCPIVLFDRSVDNDYLGRFGYQYGRATFMGFDSWIAIFMEKIGVNYNSTSYITEYLEENYYQYDKSGNTANYAYTGLLYHYLDFGFIGIIIFPLLFGFLYSKIILLLYRQPSFPTLLLLGIGYFMLLHSLFTCYFIKGWVALYISLLCFFIYFKKNRVKRVVK